MGETMRMKTANARPTAYRAGLVAALDIGSSKVACVIGRSEPGSLKVVGAALRESNGVRAGTITNLDDAVEAIGEAVAAAENHADTRIQKIIVSVACGGPTSVTSRTAMPLDGELVSDEHLNKLLYEGHRRCQREGEEVIQSAPTSYVVDEARGVRDPRGMFCHRIGVSIHAVAVKPAPLQNLKLAVQRCHLSVTGTLFSGFASAISTLTPDELQLGATVIDMGGGVTTIAVFIEGQLVFADAVPMGGTHVTADLARMLVAPFSAAERIKTLYAAALGDIETGTDMVAVPQMGEEGEEYAARVPRSTLTRIVQPRLEEIFGQVQSKLRESGYDVAAGRRAVLTGGASQLAGTRELAQRVLNKQVRIGRPQTFPGLPAASAGPDYACALGLLMAGATMPPEALNPELQTAPRERERSFFSKLTGGLFE